MKTFKSKITLVKNSRGCYILDTVKGCRACNSSNPFGCYGDCYASKIATRYGTDFSTTVKREFYKEKKQLYFFDFEDSSHLSAIVKEIKNADMPFVRIGEMGDPSEDWKHTINVCSAIQYSHKPIVIITKHWETISSNLLDDIRQMDICINTSVSALDSTDLLEHRLEQFNRLKHYCNSVLRIVTCDFNKNNVDGMRMSFIQDELLEKRPNINTVFRPSINNTLVTSGIINVKKVKFMGHMQYASCFDDDAYLGYCDTCPDQCGIKA